MSDDDYTWCDRCEHSIRQGPSYGWTCKMFPRKEGFGFVTSGVWDKDLPHQRCVNINGGACPMFKAEEMIDG